MWGERDESSGYAKDGLLCLDFDTAVLLQFRGSVVTSDAGLLAYRELDDALHLRRRAPSSSLGECVDRHLTDASALRVV
jgi:hypothetical protein